MIKQGLNRKAENLAVKILSHLALRSEMLPHFRVLRMQGCEIGKVGVKHLKTILRLPKCHIEEIDVSYNMMQSDNTNELCKVFLEPPTTTTTAAQVRLQEEAKRRTESDLIRPDEEDGTQMVKIEWDPSLPPQVKVLNLACNNLEETGIRSLCQALVLPTVRLTHLSLSNNFLHYSGCKTLVEALIENTTLRRLELAQNFIKDEGAECLSFLLGLETCLLEDLDLSDNFICTRGTYALYSVFENGSSGLRRLDLRRNETHEAAEHLKGLRRARPQTEFLFDLVPRPSEKPAEKNPACSKATPTSEDIPMMEILD